MTARARLTFLAALVVVSGACEYLPQREQQWMIVLGDAVRRGENQGWSDVAPPSTQIVPVPAPPAQPICHGEHPNAVAVAEAIRFHFPAGWWAVMCAIAWCESTFEPDAYNPSGATGLFQIMPLWHDELDVDPWTIWGSTALARFVFDAQGPDAWSCY